MLKKILLISATIALAACSHTAPRYGVSSDNVEALRAAASSGAKLSTGAFTTFEPGLNSISCRAAGGVTPPDGLTYEQFIKQAITSELKIASIYSEAASSKIEGHLDYINFNSNIGSGKWQIDMTFKSSGIDPFTINTIYPFSTNFVAEVACNQVASALPSAVQDLIAKLVAHPSFKQLVNQK
jgi:hypothetical protein